jgi:hypothetical protein
VTLRYVIVGVLGPGPLDDPVAIGPYTSQRAAERHSERLNGLSEELDDGVSPNQVFELVEVTPVGSISDVEDRVRRYHADPETDPE